MEQSYQTIRIIGENRYLQSNMKELDLEIHNNGFIYRQIMRNEYKALYEQLDKKELIAGHELFFIKRRKQREAFRKIYPAQERYPSNQDFGLSAWSIGIDRKIAIQRYHKLNKHLKTFK